MVPHLSTSHKSAWPFSKKRPAESTNPTFLDPAKSRSLLDRLKDDRKGPLTPAEAGWFLNLPDKVRRQHFNAEEQILCRAKSELVMLHAAPVHFARHDALRPTTPARRSKSCPNEDIFRESVPPMPALPRYHDQTSFPGSPVSSDGTYSSTPRVANRETFAEDPFNPPATLFGNNPSFRQSAWSYSTASTRSLPLTESSASTVNRTERVPQHMLQSRNRKTLYLGDPEAKNFLHDCSNKSRFDETLIFGFPNTPSSNKRKADVNVVSPSTRYQADSLDEDLGDIEDEYHHSEDYADRLPSVDEPGLLTPTSLVPPPHFRPVTVPDSHNYEAAPSPVVRNPSNAQVFEDLINRDLTIHLTLTKPKLRAPGEELCSWKATYTEVPPPGLTVPKDPLALEDLEFSDDVTGLHGAFAQPPKRGLRKLLSRSSLANLR